MAEEARLTPGDISVRVAVLEEIVKRIEGATLLQAKEYERRLEALNHAHALAEEKNATYVPRDNWDAVVREWTQWRQSLSFVPRELHDVMNQDMIALKLKVEEKLPSLEFRNYKTETDRALALREGKTSVADPATVSTLAAISATLAELKTVGDRNYGRGSADTDTRSNSRDSWGVISIIGGLVVAVLGILVSYVIATRPASTPAPVVIERPAQP